MNTFNRIIRKIDHFTDYVMIIFFFLFVLIALYSVYDSFMLYNEITDNAILRYKPGYESEAVDDREIKGNMVAWITVDDTNIDFPVMQGEDNVEYLNKDPFGDYALAGSIFLDFRNSGDFTDYYSLIYGHHMENHLMFGALDAYLEKGYLKEHKNGKLTVGKKEYAVRLFAVVETDALNTKIFAPTENDEETMPFVKENSLFYNKEDEVKKDERLIALSTCKFPNTSIRTIVIGALSEM